VRNLVQVCLRFLRHGEGVPEHAPASQHRPPPRKGRKRNRAQPWKPASFYGMLDRCRHGAHNHLSDCRMLTTVLQEGTHGQV
jgi:hypothetical protein